MIKFILIRIAQMIPALFLVSLLGFYISINSPGDPVDIYTQSANAQGANAKYTLTQKYADSIRTSLGLNLPVFYFSIATANDCDTLYKIKNKNERNAVQLLNRKYGCQKNIKNYFEQLKNAIAIVQNLNADSIVNANTIIKVDTLIIPSKTNKKISQFNIDTTRKIKFEFNLVNQSIQNIANSLHSLSVENKIESIKVKCDTIIHNSQYEFLSSIQPVFLRIKNLAYQIKNNNAAINNYFPKIIWHGNSNQYHKWLLQLVNGNFGYSYVDGRPVANKIWEKFIRSFTMIFIAVFLAYLIAVPIGVYSAKYHNKWFDKSFSFFIFVLYAIPSFVGGTLLIYLFSNPEFLLWFPESGYCNPENYNPEWNIFQKVYYTFPYMAMPLIAYCYGSFAYISRLVKSSMLDAMGNDYYRTAIAKGLSPNKALWKHAFKNTLLPIITSFVNVFPLAVGGSVIIESIFAYDGMGITALESVTNRDYPVLVCIFTLAGIMSMVAYFIADLLYIVVDPRISQAKSKIK